MSDAPCVRTALIGLGGNLGGVLEAFRVAVRHLAMSLGDVVVSSVYRTPAEGGAAQPDYLNAVARAETDATPGHLLDLVRAEERAAGRRRPYPGAPRTLDLDILFLGELLVSGPELTIPHPRWATRDFVVVPLLDVAPDWVDPASGRSVRAVAAANGWTSATFEQVVPPGGLDSVGGRSDA